MMDNEEKIVVQKAVRAMAAAAKEIDKLTAERDALQAQVEALSKLHSDLTNADMVFEDDVHSGYLITTEQIDEMEHLLATPAACLAQVRAEAVDMFASELAARVEVPDASPQKIEFYKAAIRHAITFAQGCAERIRQEVK